MKQKDWIMHLGLVGIYLVLTLVHLTKLPIFNDESIYLDWGFISTHYPNSIYMPLHDAKQPLVMWWFGWAQNIFRDPLVAGRLVALGSGLVTMWGMYLVAKKIGNKKIGWLAAFIFAITPLFIFYNKLALLEAPLMTFVIWSFYWLLFFLEKPEYKRGLVWGAWLSLGFWIKSTSLVFIGLNVGLVLVSLIKAKKEKWINPVFVGLITFFMVSLPLLTQPKYWQTLASNNRYTLSLGELSKFPIRGWINNLLTAGEIAFWGLTLILVIWGVWGVFKLVKKNTQQNILFLIYFLTALGLEIFLVRLQNERYLVSFLVFWPIVAAYGLGQIKNRINMWIIVCLSLVLVMMVSGWLVMNPMGYVIKYQKYNKHASKELIYGQTAGYGINELIDYLNNLAKDQMIFVGYGLTAGNPENAVSLYTVRNRNIVATYLDGKLIPNLVEYNCLASTYPVYFVSRTNQQVDLDRFLEKIKTIKTLTDNYDIGVYRLKSCEGKKLWLSDLYRPIVEQRLGLKRRW